MLHGNTYAIKICAMSLHRLAYSLQLQYQWCSQSLKVDVMAERISRLEPLASTRHWLPSLKGKIFCSPPFSGKEISEISEISSDHSPRKLVEKSEIASGELWRVHSSLMLVSYQ